MPTLITGMPYKQEKDYLAIKEERDLNMNIETFATIAGVRGKQFGKDVYSSMLKFKDLEKFLKVFPNVQRSISKKRVDSVKRYILDGITDGESKYMKFFSAITVTCRGLMFYDGEKGAVSIDTNSPMSTNDGQHRVAGISAAINELKDVIIKSKDVEERLLYQKLVDELSEMVIPVVIFNGINESQEMQLFHDLNNLQRKPSQSANIKLSQTDLFALMAKEIAGNNRYFVEYGVEYEKQMLGKKGDKTFLLNTIYNSIKVLLHSRIMNDKNFLTTENYESVKEHVAQLFDKILFSLPHDMNDKNKYIVCKSYVLSGICKYVSYAEDNLLFEDKENVFSTIKKANWEYGNHWLEYGAVIGKHETSKISFSSTSTGIRGVFTYLLALSETE